MKTKELIKKLEADGWVLFRMRGDHRIYKKEGCRQNICVPGALNDDMPRGTQASILRIAKLK